MAQIRGQFTFPLTGPQLTGTASPAVMLATGQWYDIPPGEYLVMPGQQTQLQYFDANNLQWRNVQPPQGYEQISSDGTNYRLINLSGVIVGASITNAGSGGVNGIGPVQTGSTVTFAAPTSGLASATAQGYCIVGGQVPAPTITQAGSGFLVPPIITCDPPPQGGVQASFSCTINAAGGINAVTQQNPGAGYTSIPQFYIIPQWQFYAGSIRYPGDTGTVPGSAGPSGVGGYPPGLIHPNNIWNGSPYQANLPPSSALSTAALLTGVALTGSGTLTGVVMTYPGNGYSTSTTNPAITFGGTSLGAVAASSVLSACVTTFSGSGGAAYTVGAVWETSLGLVTPVSGQLTNNVFSPRPGRGIITSAAGAGSIEDPGFGLQKVPTVGVANPGLAPTTAATFTITIGGVTDTSMVQAMVQ